MSDLKKKTRNSNERRKKKSLWLDEIIKKQEQTEKVKEKGFLLLLLFSNNWFHFIYLFIYLFFGLLLLLLVQWLERPAEAHTPILFPFHADTRPFDFQLVASCRWVHISRFCPSPIFIFFFERVKYFLRLVVVIVRVKWVEFFHCPVEKCFVRGPCCWPSSPKKERKIFFSQFFQFFLAVFVVTPWNKYKKKKTGLMISKENRGRACWATTPASKKQTPAGRNDFSFNICFFSCRPSSQQTLDPVCACLVSIFLKIKRMLFQFKSSPQASQEIQSGGMK